MKLDMNAVWARGMTLARENLQLLAVLGGIFFLLPAMVINFMMPADPAATQVLQALMDPNASQAAKDAAFAKAGEIFGPVVALSFALNFISIIGYGTMMALMGPQRPTVGEALAIGVKSVFSVFVALVIFMLLYSVAALILIIPIALIAAAIGVPALAAFAPLPVMVMAIYLMARFSLTLPVTVNEGTFNPATALKRSWTLTKPSAWGVTGFWFILGFAYMVISLLLIGAIGVIAALAGGGTASAIILGLANGLLALAVGVVVAALAVAMHQQLAGPSERTLTETFD